MKNIKHITLAILTNVLLFSCQDSLEDVYDEIGEVGTPIKTDIKYTLTEDDFKTLDLNSGKFTSFEQAETLIPTVLNKVLPNSPGAKAALMVDIYNDNNTIISNLFDAEEVTLTTEDYPTANSGAFHPNESAAELLPAIIASKVTGSESGDYYKVTYSNFTEEPSLAAAGEVISFDFTNETFNGWTPFNVTGDQAWVDQTNFGNISMNGYASGAKENEDWLVSPKIDLTGETDLKFQIDENLRYGTDLSLLKILVSENYTGDINTATWQELTITNRAYHSNNSLTPSDIVDFSAYDNKNIHIAFKYNSTTSDATRWLIGNVAITKGEGDTYTGATETLTTYYIYDGSNYNFPEIAYQLTTKDYGAMGTESGTPGEHNNFSSSISPDDYLPTLLAKKYEYATEGTQKLIVYKYFSNGVQTRFDLYSFENGAWIMPETSTETEIRFINKKGTWVSDNPIVYSLTSDDFVWISESSLKSDADYASQLVSAGQYKNFDRRPGGEAYWSDHQVLVALNLFLKDKFPETEVGTQYAVSALTYVGSSAIEEFRVILDEETGDYIYVVE
ncbi:choice-of-anchor J domain-containing protein [Wenyingzhuangia sp. chi5]|uniref:Choice-of-anchor J domain-containing protein n=1 Tax=Wenyingzhuangia gilva TaxID=3057677 RepID=A0ABT8VQ12_9FLAO|nr:choice-of-anchor J domain-containing protein [Wenyingzhuangia sp. chi5]MDO3694054.1 choice-of-anchor J domain-containing protein [Wenyingzhuangia sp. chi5]